MKKTGILNSEIAKVLADLGHTDTICIGDCGLPIPAGVKRIDLALRRGQPTFLDVLHAVEEDMQIERITLASEIKTMNPAVLREVETTFPGVETGFVSHEDFKKQLVNVKAVIRTGEVTPYANIILHAGVIF